MEKTLGTLIVEDNKIILEHNDGTKEIFLKDKPDYSKGSQWFDYNGERFFLKQN